MLELPNIRFVFFLRTSHQNENKQSAIVLRVIFQKERTDMFTGLYCAEKDWDREAGRVKNIPPDVSIGIGHRLEEIFVH